MKDKIVAALLAFFLGGIGIHRFYLGQTGLGIIYLLFFWTGIPFLISIIDGIVFLVADKENFDYKYNRKRLHQASTSSVNIYNNYEPNRPYEQYDRFNNNTAKGKHSTAEEIEKLHDLMVKGIISEKEFIDRKNRLL